MSKILTLSEQRLNEKAICYFKQECESPDLFTTRVKAFNGNGDLIFDDIIQVRVVEQHSWIEVPIFWEDSGISRANFRSLGLYGVYSTTYNRMQFLQDNNQLKIQSNDSSIYILIDAQ